MSRDYRITYKIRMDDIFKALNDPARRTLLDALRARDGQTLTELESTLAMSRFGVMKHLKVLEEAHLVLTRREGRYKYHHLNTLPLAEVLTRWIEPMLARPMTRAMIALKARLEETPMAKPDFMMSTYIRCTQDALWSALTDETQMPHFGFFADRVTREGASYTFHSNERGTTMRTVHTALTPKSRIESTFEPLWAEGLPPSRFVYTIQPAGDACKLTLEHYDLPAAQAEGVADGWPRLLSGLKTWLETGQTAKFAVQAA